MTDTPRKSIQALFDENPWPRNMVKARKDHRCDVCGYRIDAGTQYVAEVVYPGDGNDNDDIFTWKSHPDCDILFKKFGEAMDWEPPWASDWTYWLEELEAQGVDYPAHWCRQEEEPS